MKTSTRGPSKAWWARNDPGPAIAGGAVKSTSDSCSSRCVGRKEGRSLWWLHPGVAVAAVVLPTVAIAHFASPTTYQTVWGTRKHFNSDALIWVLLSLVAVALPAFALARRRSQSGGAVWPNLSESQLGLLERSFIWCYRLALVGYCAWMWRGLQRGVSLGQVVGIFTDGGSATFGLKESFETVAGITTLSQVGVAAAVIGGLIWNDRPFVRRRVAVLIVLALLRSIVYTERLALLELVIPLGVIATQRAWLSGSSRNWRLLRVAPMIAVPLLVLGFTASEATRSWSFHSRETDHTVLEFGGLRLAGYYATAYNNAEILRWAGHAADDLPYRTVEALWEAPLLSNWLQYEQLTGIDPDEQYRLLLQRYGNPEFNNGGGLTSPNLDWGKFGGAVVLVLTGAVLGGLFWGFRSATPMGLLLYPAVYVGILELPRIWYWTLGRSAPIYVALLIVAVQFGRQARLSLTRP